MACRNANRMNTHVGADISLTATTAMLFCTIHYGDFARANSGIEKLTGSRFVVTHRVRQDLMRASPERVTQV